MKNPPNGSILLTSLLVIAIASMLATAITWKSYSSIIRVEAQKDIAQARWISKAAIDYARWILMADIRGFVGHSSQIDHLQEPWAQEIPYIKIDKLFRSRLSEEEQRFFSLAALSGKITDEQSKFNLARITDSKKTLHAEKGLKILFQKLKINELKFKEFLNLLRKQNSVLLNEFPSKFNSLDLKHQRTKRLKKIISQLKLNSSLEKKLIDSITWLPKPTPININTASAVVIASTLIEPNEEKLTYLFQTVRKFPLKSLSEFVSVYSSPNISGNLIGFKSSFFSVKGYAHYGKAEINFQALIRRYRNKTEVIQLEVI